ncbi:MAG: hypothetical protein M1391_05120 [Bacteroidetes bacterium]|nr:hypothetical protein [Bacteroidota bacterium]
MKNKSWIIFRIVVFVVLGLLYTVFISPEETGTWKYYFGFVLLFIALVDVVRLVRIPKKKDD